MKPEKENRLWRREEMNFKKRPALASKRPLIAPPILSRYVANASYRRDNNSSCFLLSIGEKW